jgi:hypothetical protein
MNYNPGCVGPVRSISPDQGRLMLATLYAADRKHLSNAFIPLRTSDVAVGTTLDGRTQIFVSGNDGRVASRWKVGDSNSNWTDWSSFDGFGPVSSIATVRHTRSEVFAISGGKLFNRYQFNDQGGWTSWTSFAPESDYLDVATAIASDGRRMLWASTTDGRLWSFIKASTDPSSGWIGRTLVASDNVGPFTIATIPNANRLQLFEISGTRLKTRWQNSNGGWSNLDDFGLSAFDVSAGRTQDGRLAVYAVALDGTLWVREKISTDPNSSWKDWQKLPSSQNYDFLGVVAGNLQDGRPQLFGIRYGGVWSAYWDGSSWQGWWTF